MKRIYDLTRLLVLSLGTLCLVGGGAMAQSFPPKQLGDSVNSDSYEVNPVLSRTGDTLFFGRINHPENRYGAEDSQDIWMATKDKSGEFTKVQRLPNTVNIARYNALYSCLNNGQYLIGGTFDKPGTVWLRRGFSLIRPQGAGQWSKPERILVWWYSSMSEGDFANASMTPDGKYLFMSFSSRWSGKRNRLYVSVRKDPKEADKMREQKLAAMAQAREQAKADSIARAKADSIAAIARAEAEARGEEVEEEELQISSSLFQEKPAVPPMDSTVYWPEAGKKWKYTRPRALRGPVSDFYSAEAPHYVAKEKRLYFSGVREKDAKGKNKIYYMSPENLAEAPHKWTNLQVLSDTINLEGWNSYFRPSPDGVFAYYCSTALTNRSEAAAPAAAANAAEGEGVSKPNLSYEALETAGKVQKSNIWKVMLLESKPWAKITGKVVMASTGKMVPANLRPVVLVDGEKSDSLVMEAKAARFVGLLPLDSIYRFSVRMENYISDTVVLDLRGQQRYVEKEVVLKVKSVPYVMVTGRMLNNLTLAPIAAKHKPYIIIDQKKVDSVKYDLDKGTYSVKLPFGKKYTVKLKAQNHQGVDMDLDLMSYKEYQQVTFDVFAKPENANMVTLGGKIINTKTGQPLEKGIAVQMKVNKQINDGFQYSKNGGSYRLTLSAGEEYEIVPSVKNFYSKVEFVDLHRARPRSKVRRDFYVTPLEVGQSVDIENIFFDTGKSKLLEPSFRSLNALLDFFNEYPNVKVEVGGHTDNRGSAAYNRRLSQARAQAVADYLISHGVGRDRFSVKGYGPDKPRATNKTKAGQAKNRRVGFTIEAL